jgi:DNA-damage-inducible protein J
MHEKEVSIVNSKLSNVSFRIDSDIKNQADRLFAELGLNMTTAFNIFLRQSVREGSIPFQITVNTPNAETVAAMLEAEKITADPSIKRYSDVEEALKELKA